MGNELKYMSNMLITINLTGMCALVIEEFLLELSRFEYGITPPTSVKHITVMLLFPPYALMVGSKRLLSFFYLYCLNSRHCIDYSDTGMCSFFCKIVEMCFKPTIY